MKRLWHPLNLVCAGLGFVVGASAGAVVTQFDWAFVLGFGLFVAAMFLVVGSRRLPWESAPPRRALTVMVVAAAVLLTGVAIFGAVQ